MTVDAAWVAASASAGTLGLGALTYRIVRRQNVHVAWSVDLPEPGATRSRLRLRNTGTTVARDVDVKFSGPAPAPPAISVSRDVYPGGMLTYGSVVRRLGQKEPTVVTVTWRPRVGRRRSWSCAL